jgi:predicted DNA-binding transcriptional regulator AlpA
MNVPLAYPVLWADAKTAAKLICMAESTFRQHVASGLLPPGVEIGGKRLWRVADVDEALAKLLPSAKDADEPGTDPVLEALHGRRGNGRAANPKT